MRPTGRSGTANLPALMETQLKSNTHREANTTANLAPPASQLVLLGMDVHAAHISVCRKFDGLPLQPVQKMTAAKLLAWVKGQRRPGLRIVCCYEAGPCGYWLQRQLQALGIECLVIAPEDWDERGQRVKTDARDARILCQRLARYVGGDLDAFAVVYTPTPEQEERRGVCRQRGAVVSHRQRAVSRGRALALLQGIRLKGGWWTPRRWPSERAQLPPTLAASLELWVQQAQWLETQRKVIHTQVVALAPAKTVPFGLGALTWMQCATEVVDWARFNNRREVSSYTGLCPSEHSSGASRRQGSINRHGNPRLRHALIEAVWRLLRFQPTYHVWKKLPDLLQPTLGARQRKRLVVAAARRLAIDLWRLATNRTTPEKLGLRLPTPLSTATATATTISHAEVN